MKTAAKVFIIIGMVFTFYLIYPIIIGSMALKKLNTETKASELTAMGVVTLLFVSLLGGIFMLCLKDEDLAENASAPSQN